jgi:PAS domain S-box-containing protein
VSNSSNHRAALDQALLAAIVESSDDGIISIDLSGIIDIWNAGAEKLYVYAASEVVGQPINILIPGDRADEELGILDRIRHGERIEHYETVRRRKNGELADISLTISQVKNPEGLIIGASKIAPDITRRKRDAELVDTLNRIVGETGALSNGTGKISVTWGLQNQRARLSWQETDGPPVAAPARKGFELMLVEQATAGKASLEFEPGGVVCSIELQLAASAAPGVANPTAAG